MKYLEFFRIIIFTLCISSFLIPIRLWSSTLEDEQKGEVGRIAYCSVHNGYWQIWVMDSGGKNSHRITDSHIDKRFPSWAADGKKIVYRTNDGKLGNVDIDTKKESILDLKLTGLTDPRCSPKGEKIAFARFRPGLVDNCDLWISDIDGTDARRIVSDRGLQVNPAWSPDGEKLAYVSSYEPSDREIWVIDVDRKDRKRLTVNVYFDVEPCWSPDGNNIAFSSNRSGNFEIWVMDADGKNQKQVTHHPDFDGQPAWSPDGNEIVFVSNRGGNLQLWSIDVDSENPRQLTSSDSECRDPSFLMDIK
jgi:TolB protein